MKKKKDQLMRFSPPVSQHKVSAISNTGLAFSPNLNAKHPKSLLGWDREGKFSVECD